MCGGQKGMRHGRQQGEEKSQGSQKQEKWEPEF